MLAILQREWVAIISGEDNESKVYRFEFADTLVLEITDILLYGMLRMNCLTEALGLSLRGNGTMLATHADRKRLFLEAGNLIADLARRYYEQGDPTVLRHDARHRHGGSTNTVLYLLAAAKEGCVASRRAMASWIAVWASGYAHLRVRT